MRPANKTEFTKEQIKKINFWRNFLLSDKSKLNKKKATEVINAFYDKLNYKHPEIVFCDNPVDLQIKANKFRLKYCKEWNIFSNSTMWLNAASDVVDTPEFSPISKIIYSLFKQIPRTIAANEFDYITSVPMLNQDPKCMDTDSVEAIETIAIDCGFTNHNRFSENDYKLHKDFLLAGMYLTISKGDYCFVCGLPKNIELNDVGMLHCSTDSAVTFEDGFGISFINGVNVPDFWTKETHKITRETVLKERNSERKRCLKELLGNDKFVELLDMEIIDEDFDAQNNIMRLFKSKHIDPAFDDYWYFLNVVCPSTQREYYLSVAPTNNIWTAKASLFNNLPIKFRHGDVALLEIAKPFDRPIFET